VPGAAYSCWEATVLSPVSVLVVPTTPRPRSMHAIPHNGLADTATVSRIASVRAPSAPMRIVDA
jgi:hypothetical protein